ncbi:MAG: DUF4159 domain-containing protein, partial [Planctomycetota bacterium]|nr:DUF4159 domain-containing protein [Planctomycetota bacterium]
EAVPSVGEGATPGGRVAPGSDVLPPELRAGLVPIRRKGPLVPLTPVSADSLDEEERFPDALTFDPKTFASQRGSITFGEVDDAAIGKAIRAGVARLWQEQRANGSWPAFGTDPGQFNYQSTGPTAMAVYTLIESGVRVEDDRIKKAITWLSQQSEEHTYSVGLRAGAYAAAYRKAGGDLKGKLAKFLRADVDQLMAHSQQGAYGYYASGKHSTRSDNSNSQYGVLGVWAAALAGMEIPEKYWRLIAEHWSKAQNNDGGWGYGSSEGDKASRGTMTAAGLATMMVCYEQLMASKFLICGSSPVEMARLEAGLKWLASNFGKAGSEWTFYYWYGVERVGLASGLKYFGKVDWYKEGAAKLLGASGWQAKETSDVCFTLLFLIRGRRPVLFNHLQYKGDWNNRPQALASLTQWLSDNFEHVVGWQNISIDAPVAEWHDAPILLLTGARKPNFTPANLESLRTYVAQGGMIFSVTECDGDSFDKGMREVYKALFPKYELARAGPKHEIFSSRSGFTIATDTQIHIMSNGMRPLVIHTDQDLVKSWQVRQTTSERINFELAGAVVHYVMLDTKTMASPRGQGAWPGDDAVLAELTGGLKIARLQHSGNCDPEPLALKRFALVGKLKDGISLEPTDLMPIVDLPASEAKIATLVSTGSFSLPDSDLDILRDFVTRGGTLLFEGAGGNESFLKSALAVVSKMFPGEAPQLLPPDHRLYRTGVVIKSVMYRPKTIRRLGRIDTPRLIGLSVGGKVRVIISPEDISGGLLGVPFSSVDGYRPQSAQAIMRNIVAYAHVKTPDPAPK